MPAFATCAAPAATCVTGTFIILLTRVWDLRTQVYAFSVDASSRGTAGGPTARSGAATGHASVRMLNMEAGTEVKLATFMAWAGPQMLAALGMSPAARGLAFAPDPRGAQGLSGGLLHLGWDALLAHRPVTAVAFSPSPTEPLLLAAYGPVGAQLGAGELLKVGGCWQSANIGWQTLALEMGHALI